MAEMYIVLFLSFHLKIVDVLCHECGINLEVHSSEKYWVNALLA